MADSEFPCPLCRRVSPPHDVMCLMTIKEYDPKKRIRVRPARKKGKGT